MIRNYLAATIVTVAISSPVFAQAEARVVLNIEPSATLTPAFRKSLRDTISVELRSSMDGLAKFSVIDLAELRAEDRLPSWTAAFAQGLDKVTASSDPARTHYVRIALVDGQYVVESRWADGSLGWISPAVQKARTTDREGITRQVLAQITHDSGVVGRVVRSDGDRTATLQVADNRLNSNVGRWVRVGDVFAIVQLSGDGQSARIPNALLRVVNEPSAGRTECRIESRYVNPLHDWESGKYRAIQLPSSHDKVRVHVSALDPNLLEGVSVRVSAIGFDRPESASEAAPLRRGEFTSQNSYDRIAFVRLMAGDRIIASQVPVEVLGNSAVGIEIRAEAGDDKRPLDVDLRLIRNRISELSLQVSEDNSQIRVQIEKGKNREALERVNQVLTRMEDRLPRLTLDLSALGRRQDLAGGISEAERALRDIISAQKSLQGVKRSLENAISSADSPESVRRCAALELQVTQAERAVDEADYDKAIVIYEEVLRGQSDWPNAKRRLDELKQGWRIHSDEHRQARKTIYETLTDSTTAEEISKSLEGARSAFAICKTVGDRYTPRKLYLSLQRVAGVLAKRGEELRMAQGEDATKQRDQLRRTATQASELLTEVESYLSAK